MPKWCLKLPFSQARIVLDGNNLMLFPFTVSLSICIWVSWKRCSLSSSPFLYFWPVVHFNNNNNKTTACVNSSQFLLRHFLFSVGILERIENLPNLQTKVNHRKVYHNECTTKNYYNLEVNVIPLSPPQTPTHQKFPRPGHL